MRSAIINRVVLGLAILLMASASPKIPYAKTIKSKQAVTFSPESVDSFSGAFLAAMIAQNDLDYKMAARLYKQALKFDPNVTIVRDREMLFEFIAGHFDEGIKLARQVRRGSEANRIASLMLGVDAMRKSHYKTAATQFDAKEDNDLDRLAFSLLHAWAILGQGKTELALKSVAHIKGPQWFSIFKTYEHALIALKAERFELARKNLETIVTDPVAAATTQNLYHQAVLTLARIEQKAGQKRKALDTIALGENSAGVYAHYRVARQMIEANKALPDAAHTIADGAQTVLTSISGALGQSMRNNSDPSVSQILLIYLQAAKALDPNSVEANLLLAQQAEREHKLRKAIDYYQQIPKTSPYWTEAETRIGLILADLHEPKKSIQHLQALIDADPQNYRNYLALGSVYSSLKDYRAMAANYDRIVKLIGPAPLREHWGIFYQRGIAYERLKEWNKAEPNFEQALKLYPNQPQVLNYLGYSWIDMNIHLKKGMAMIRKAATILPNDGYIVDSLGWAYYRLGEYEKAVHVLERAVSLSIGDATINDHLGDALWKVGRRLEAVYQWKRALLGKPEPKELKQIEYKIKNGLNSAMATENVEKHKK